MSQSPEDTARFAQKVANALAGHVAAATLRSPYIYMKGELGSGKTTFVSALAHCLQSTDDVMSPTFVVQRRLKLPSTSMLAPHISSILHIDAYRFETPEEAAVIGFTPTQVPAEPHTLYIIEWPEKLPAFSSELPQPYYIHCTHVSEFEREFVTDILE